jgi:hypothetical protein
MFSTPEAARVSGTNRELIQRFESGAIPAESFHHADHVRLAFAYLCEYPVFEALQRFCLALKRFAETLGKSQLYNETITCAYLFLIHERMLREQCNDWEVFASSNSDLFVWKDGILSRYYAEGTLRSDFARRVFVLPDKCLEGRRSG